MMKLTLWAMVAVGIFFVPATFGMSFLLTYAGWSGLKGVARAKIANAKHGKFGEE